MSKILQFKEWLTIPEATEYLAKELKETVSISDLYLLALKDEITLSVILPEFGATAKITVLTSLEEQIAFHNDHKDMYEHYNLYLEEFIQDDYLNEKKLKDALKKVNNPTLTNYALHASKTTSLKPCKDLKLSRIYKIWDIVLTGDSDTLLKRLYHESSNRIYEEPFVDGGITLQSLDKKNYAQLYEELTKQDLSYIPYTKSKITLEGLSKQSEIEIQQRENQEYFNFQHKIELEMPISTLPIGTEVIIRIENLHNFLESLNQVTKKATFNNREKNNILKLLFLLLKNQGDLNGLPLDQPYKAADILISFAQLNSYDIPSKETIVKIIKESLFFDPN